MSLENQIKSDRQFGDIEFAGGSLNIRRNKNYSYSGNSDDQVGKTLQYLLDNTGKPVSAKVLADLLGCELWQAQQNLGYVQAIVNTFSKHYHIEPGEASYAIVAGAKPL